MTHRLDVARGRDIVARWCDLAEQRLEYLTELFETGRWRRFYSEAAFRENIQEAKTAVETWRNLLTREASLDNSAVDMSWLGHSQKPLPPARKMPERIDLPRSLSFALAVEPKALPIASSPPARSIASVPAEPIHVRADEAPSAPAMAAPILKDFAAPKVPMASSPAARSVASAPARTVRVNTDKAPPVPTMAAPAMAAPAMAAPVLKDFAAPKAPPMALLPAARSMAPVAAEPRHVKADDAPSAPAMAAPILKDFSALTLDAIAQRYPLLRNAL